MHHLRQPLCCEGHPHHLWIFVAQHLSSSCPFLIKGSRRLLLLQITPVERRKKEKKLDDEGNDKKKAILPTWKRGRMTENISTLLSSGGDLFRDKQEVRASLKCAECWSLFPWSIYGHQQIEQGSSERSLMRAPWQTYQPLRYPPSPSRSGECPQNIFRQPSLLFFSTRQSS